MTLSSILYSLITRKDFEFKSEDWEQLISSATKKKRSELLIYLLKINYGLSKISNFAQTYSII